MRFINMNFIIFFIALFMAHSKHSFTMDQKQVINNNSRAVSDIIRYVDINSDGTRLAMSNGELVTVWGVNQKNDFEIIKEFKYKYDEGLANRQNSGRHHLVRVIFNPVFNILVSRGYSGQITVWELDNDSKNEPLQCFGGCFGPINFSPDGKKLASGDLMYGIDADIRIWKIDEIGNFNQHQDTDISGFTNSIDSICFSPNGDIMVSCYANQGFQIWKLDEEDKFKLSQRSDDSWLCSYCKPSFSSDGKLLATSTRCSLEIWQLGAESKFEPRQYIEITTPDQILDLKFSPDDKRLVLSRDVDTGSRWTLKPHIVYIDVWEFNRNGQLELGFSNKIEEHLNKINSLSFSSNILVSASDDKIMICNWLPEWSPEKHQLFSESFKNRVFVVLLSNKTLGELKIPKPFLFYIIKISIMSQQI